MYVSDFTQRSCCCSVPWSTFSWDSEWRLRRHFVRHSLDSLSQPWLKFPAPQARLAHIWILICGSFVSGTTALGLESWRHPVTWVPRDSQFLLTSLGMSWPLVLRHHFGMSHLLALVPTTVFGGLPCLILRPFLTHPQICPLGCCPTCTLRKDTSETFQTCQWRSRKQRRGGAEGI